jgi:hypothetical protein
MSVRKPIVPLVLASLAAVAAVLLLLAAVDVKRWQGGLANDDVRFSTAPAASDLWQVNALLPGDPARRVLSISDDVRYRRAVQAFVAAHPRDPGFLRPELEAARVKAQVRLREIAQRETNAERRSEMLNLLGALSTAAARWQQQTQERVDSLEASVGYFTRAVHADRANEDAMFNLEVLLRRLGDEPPSFETPGGRLPRDNASLGGLRSPGTGY